jgi:DNA-binding response OmpR family regulator
VNDTEEKKTRVSFITSDNLLEAKLRDILDQETNDNKITTSIFINVSEGVKNFSENIPDVVFVDTYLDGMDILEVVKKIRSISRLTRIVVMSNSMDLTWLNTMLSAGVNDFMTKIFDRAELYKTISENIKRHRD